MSKRTCLILGVGGMDGSHLADILLEQGAEVHGMHRRTSLGNLSRIEHCKDRVTLHRGDMADGQSLDRIIRDVHPTEIYNEADQDNVDWSRSSPVYSADITYAGVVRLLECVREFDKSIRVFQPCTAMMYGDTDVCPQSETTPFNPMSPYAVSKLAAYYACNYYRLAHDMFVSSAILFNHDSPRRSEEYLLHKICASCVRIARGQQQTLALGNLDLKVDIGFSPEFMEAAVKMLQLPTPDDFVIGTGQASEIREMVERAYRRAITFAEKGVWEYAPESVSVSVDPKFSRPGKQTELRADISKARSVFGFDPQMSVFDVIEQLVEHYSGASK